MQNTSQGQQGSSETVKKAGFVCLAVNICLTILKGIVGITSGSRALTADAFHSLSDLTTDVAVVVGVRFWSRPPDDSHPLGHSGIETAVAMFIGVMLIAAGAGIGYDSVKVLGTVQSAEPPGLPAVAAAAVSIAIKEGLYRWTLKKSRQTRSAALAANARHNRSDAFSSIPVLVAVTASVISPKLAFIDGLAGAVVSVFIMISGFKVLEPCLQQMMNTAPPGELVEKIKGTILDIDGVTGFHNLRARMQAGGVFVDLHLQVEGKIQVEKAFLIARKVEESIRDLDPSILDVIARVEPWAPCGDADRCYHDF